MKSIAIVIELLAVGVGIGSAFYLVASPQGESSAAAAWTFCASLGGLLVAWIIEDLKSPKPRRNHR